MHGHGRRESAVVLEKQGRGVDHGGIRNAAARYRKPHAARNRPGRPFGAHARNPTLDRAQLALGRRHGRTRRTLCDHRLRRDPGRRRDADGLDHRRLRSARAGLERASGGGKDRAPPAARLRRRDQRGRGRRARLTRSRLRRRFCRRSGYECRQDGRRALRRDSRHCRDRAFRPRVDGPDDRGGLDRRRSSGCNPARTHRSDPGWKRIPRDDRSRVAHKNQLEGKRVVTGLYRFCSLLFLSASLFAASAFAQTEVFEDPDGKYVLNLPSGWLGVVNTDGLGRNEVNIVYKVRENGALKIRVAEVAPGAEPMDYAAQDERERVRFAPSYDKISLEKFLLGGTRTGALLSYDYKNASGQPFTGRVYYLRADEKTIYVLQFTGRRNILGTLRSHTDLIARSLKLKSATPPNQ